MAHTVPGLRVTAKADGFRRAGRAWSTSPVDVPLSEFDDDQVAALKEEPGLVVADIDIEAPDDVGNDIKPAATKAAAKKK